MSIAHATGRNSRNLVVKEINEKQIKREEKVKEDVQSEHKENDADFKIMSHIMNNNMQHATPGLMYPESRHDQAEIHYTQNYRKNTQ